MQAVVVHERRVVVHASHVLNLGGTCGASLDQNCGCDGPQRVGTCADCPSDSLPASVDFEYRRISLNQSPGCTGRACDRFRHKYVSDLLDDAYET
jgi:hypothetical protein